MLPQPAKPEAGLSELPIDVGLIANEVAARHAFDDYRSRKSANTLRAQDGDLARFEEYLRRVAGVEADLLHPDGWHRITWGLVEGFVKWMLLDGYAIGSVNRSLSTVKRYAGLATKAGTVSAEEHALIRLVAGYGHSEAVNIDEKREQTRKYRQNKPVKRDKVVSLSVEQAKALKKQPDTPQGLRDRLLMCLLLDHGLRVGEVAALKVGNIHLGKRQMRFVRPKVKSEQTHNLSRDTLEAARVWLESGHALLAADAPLLRGSRRGGALTAAGMSERKLTERVRVLGERVGIEGLSAHACRHFWATYHASRVNPLRLQEAGGWSSLAMPRRYVKAAEVANQGMGEIE